MKSNTMGRKYVVTAYSRLARARVEVSRPVDEEDACKLLEKMLQYLKLTKHRHCYLHPKIERIKPIQLTLNFTDE